MTNGGEDGEDSAASDSEPSEDNLEEAEMAKIIPVKAKEKDKTKIRKTPIIKPTVMAKRFDEKSPTAGHKQRGPLPAKPGPVRSPMKRIL